MKHEPALDDSDGSSEAAAARRLAAIGAIFAFLSVAIGAFGAHALQSILEHTKKIHVFETGVQYQMAHSLALLLLAGLCGRIIPSRKLAGVSACFTVGILLFCGSLYALAITNNRKFGIITPFGGILFLYGWATIIVAALRGYEEK